MPVATVGSRERPSMRTMEPGGLKVSAKLTAGFSQEAKWSTVPTLRVTCRPRTGGGLKSSLKRTLAYWGRRLPIESRGRMAASWTGPTATPLASRGV